MDNNSWFTVCFFSLILTLLACLSSGQRSSIRGDTTGPILPISTAETTSTSVPTTAPSTTRDPHIYPTPGPMPDIKGVRVECSMEINTMIINFEFGTPFFGKVYPKGYYKFDECSANGSGQKRFAIFLPLDGCGTQSVQAQDTADQTLYRNTIILMGEAAWGILEMGDKAFSVMCDMTTSITNKVTSGVTVPMLTTTEIPVGTPMRLPSCRMKIVSGDDPQNPPASSIDIGEIATLAFYIEDEGRFDLAAHQCYAHDGVRGGKRIELISKYGCSSMPKIIGQPQYERDVDKQLTYVYYYMKVFKFPDIQNVYFDCQCSICFGACTQFECGASGISGSLTKEDETRKRKRRDVSSGDDVPQEEVTVENMHIVKSLKVIVPDDSNLAKDRLIIETNRQELCMDRRSAVAGIAAVVAIIIILIVIVVLCRITRKDFKVCEKDHERSNYD